jgi:hypothetical membrane protein
VKKEYKAKAEEYELLFIIGFVFFLIGIFKSGFVLFTLIGIILIIVGIIGLAYYSAKEAYYGAKEKSLKYCKYCGEEIPYDAMFCPKCGREQK